MIQTFPPSPQEIPEEIDGLGRSGGRFQSKICFSETNQTMNSERYIDRVLRPVVIPACKWNNFTLQQDGATCHTSGKTRKVVNDENLKFWES